jgi:hypothetical protein
MTAFTAANIPTQINTLERLAAWACLALHRINPTQAILEVPNTSPEKVAQAVLINADDDSIRLVTRIAFKVDPAYIESTDKFWLNVQEFSNTTLPTAFTTN